MREQTKSWLRPALFALGGALAGLAYYYGIGCSTGICPITSTPLISMAYVGVIGWLLSCVIGTKDKGTKACGL